MTREQAVQLRQLLELQVDGMEDAVIINFPAFVEKWNGDGVAYEVGKRVSYNDVVYKVLQAHTSQPTWNPADVPSLFAKVINEQDEQGEWPVWEQPDSTNAYSKGDKVWYPDRDGKLYECQIDGNVWSPVDYPAGWKEITE